MVGFNYPMRACAHAQQGLCEHFVLCEVQCYILLYTLTVCTSVVFLQGTHPSLKANTNAKATVTAIIDGTGSMGAAFGPLLVGVISDSSVSIGIYSQYDWM